METEAISKFHNIFFLVDSLLGENITDDELLSLVRSDAVDYFIEVMMQELTEEEIATQNILNVWQYNNFLYSVEYKLEMRRFAFWSAERTQRAETIRESKYRHVRSKAKKFNLKPFSEKYIRDPLALFVKNHLVNCKEDLAYLITDTMEMCRMAPGIFNKYDDIDHETAYIMSVLADDIEISYDDFLNRLKKKKSLPIHYPVEFILRIISRVLNVTINLYDYDMNQIVIDNSVTNTVFLDPISIYRYGDQCYYLLVPRDIEEGSTNYIEVETINSLDVVEI
jgi:hypothetical protein